MGVFVGNFVGCVYGYVVDGIDCVGIGCVDGGEVGFVGDVVYFDVGYFMFFEVCCVWFLWFWS